MLRDPCLCPGLKGWIKRSRCFSIPGLHSLNSLNSSNWEVKSCWIWCCLLQSTGAEDQRLQKSPSLFCSERDVSTPPPHPEEAAGWQINRDPPRICKRNLGKDTPGESSCLQSSLGLKCLYLPCSPLSKMKEQKRKQKENIPHLLFTCFTISEQRNYKCVWAHFYTSLGRGGQTPITLISCVHCCSHAQMQKKPQPARARPPHSQAPSPASCPQLQRNHQMLLTYTSLSLPLPLPSLCTGSGRGCCFSCCKWKEASSAEMVFLWAALSEIPQKNTDSFMSLSEFDCSPNTGRALGLSSSTVWISGERNNRPEADNWSHQNTPGDGNPRLWSSTLAFSDTSRSRRSSVSHWPWEPNQVEDTLFMNLYFPEWFQVIPKSIPPQDFYNPQMCSMLSKSIKKPYHRVATVKRF